MKKIFSKQAVVIITFTILLAGNILGLLSEPSNAGQWNLNKTLAFFSEYYSFSTADWYVLERIRDFSARPDQLRSFLPILDMGILLSGLLLAIFCWKTKTGRLAIFFILSLIVVVMLMVTIREKQTLDFFYVDYLPSGWTDHVKKVLHNNCYLPRIIYMLFIALSFYMLVSKKREGHIKQA